MTLSENASRIFEMLKREALDPAVGLAAVREGVHRFQKLGLRAITEPTKRRNLSQDKALIRSLWNKRGGRCAVGGEAVALENATIDHVVPLALGGTDDRRNLRMTCGPHNSEKNASDVFTHSKRKGQTVGSMYDDLDASESEATDA
jgi:hypothetical protein